MKLGIMQPYVFPYLGYFQLIQAVDKFVVYDDVNYIKQGWINRNKIFFNEQEVLFSVPVKNASSFKLIHEIEIGSTYSSWKEKFCKTVSQAYRKAPYFEDGYALVQRVFEANARSISELAYQSIRLTSEYLNLGCEFVPSSVVYENKHLSGQARVLDICRRENASAYFNAIGGSQLYSKSDFQQQGISLSFIKPDLKPYKQIGQSFVPGLSIIDVLMNVNKEEAAQLLANYQLV